MDDFERALGFVLRWEGGKVHDPLDHGGRTNRGITQRTYDGWRQEQGLEERDVWKLEEEELRAIYRSLYWWPARNAEWPLSLVLFDSAVLFGAGRALAWAQVVSWRDAPPEAQAWAVLCLRRERHRERVAKEPKQRRFLAGWMNRLDALAGVAGLVSGEHGGSTAAQAETGQQPES